METVKSRILIRKLGYLLHLLSDGAEGGGASAFHALLDDPDSLCIVKECRELVDRWSLLYIDLGIFVPKLCET